MGPDKIPRVVLAAYKPRLGMEDELLRIVEKHVVTLREEGLVSKRDNYVLRSASGAVIEIFEWLSEEAVEQAHTNKKIGSIWHEINSVADFVSLGDIEECGHPFPHFEVI